jgi:aspartate dehydrogenase
LALAAVSARDFDKARQKIGAFLTQPRLVELEELAEWADIVVECAPASVYDRIAHPAVETARVLVTTSCGALLSRPELIDRARKTGARIIVPSGGILGLDALKAAAEGDVYSVTLITRKPPSSLAGARYLSEHAIDVLALKEPLRVFAGNAREAVLAFPASANVAATLSLAGIGAERTQVEIWADPFVSHNIQCVQVRAAAADFDLRLASHPLADNPRTGSLTPKSVVATLRSLRSHLTIGGI